MTFKQLGGGTLALLAMSCFGWACSGKADDCAANASCGPYDGGAAGIANAGSGSGSGNAGASGQSQGGNSSRAGSSGDAGAAGAASGCDPNADPSSDPCVISRDYGLFVAKTGNDLNSGSPEKPFLTVTAALAASSGAGLHRVYVCAGTYAEADTLEVGDRTEIYGGFRCDDLVWSYDRAVKANLTPQKPVAMIVRAAKNGAVLQDLRIESQNAPDGVGASSFGVMVINDSADVRLERVVVQAGKGGSGKNGTDGGAAQLATASGTAQDGKSGVCNGTLSLTGGTRAASVCGSEGGQGGMSVTGVGSNGTKGLPDAGDNGGPAGSAALPPGVTGKDGQPGDPGAVGVVAGALGAFSSMGYLAADGGSGGVGKPGQGGGGGGASYGPVNCIGSSGGAGGMGGCGGAPGTGGGGGGASVALFVWNSSVSVVGGELHALQGGAGGKGGRAGEGSSGVAGGAGGMAVLGMSIQRGGSGGPGGDGGNGGNGSGGTGGPSFALAYNTTVAPTLSSTPTLTVLAGGIAGSGGDLGLPLGYAGKVGASKAQQKID